MAHDLPQRGPVGSDQVEHEGRSTGQTLARSPKALQGRFTPLKADQEVGFRVPAPSAIRAMHDPHTTTSLDEILIYEDGELVFDGSDPSTYTVYETAADLAAALTAGPEPEDDR